MDQLDVWAVRGRVATAIRSMREALARLAVDSEELAEAMAEAEQLGICDAAPAAEPMWGSAR